MYFSFHCIILQVLDNVTIDYLEMVKIHDEAEDQFVNLTSSFVGVVNDIKEHSFLTVIDDVTQSSTLFDATFFDDITDDSLLTKQDIVYMFEDEFSDNTTIVNNIIYAWSTIYSLTNELVANSTTVTDIYSGLNLVFAISSTSEIMAEGASLLARDIVCFIAQTHYNSFTTYDYYNLTRMLQDNCDVTESEWLEIYSDAEFLRLMELVTVEVQVPPHY